ncbi:MAG TPA: SDR family NAD(P)-dependent oxidoreductase, partial [Parasegetibacter sp.]
LEVIQLNIASLLTLTKLFGEDMVARNEGKILHLGSEAGKTPVPYLAVYAATKAFVVSFSTALANELKDTGVTVTVLLPGATDTDFFHKANMEESVTYKEKKLDSPEMVAQKGYEALMSGETRVITGQARKNVAMAAVMPDETSAKQIRKSMEPSELNENEGRQYSEHEPSRKERESIRHAAGDQSSDYPSGDANNLSRNYGNRSSDDTPRDYPGRNRDDPSPDPASGNETF